MTKVIAKQGNSDDNVKIINTMLKNLGYKITDDKGFFDSNTKFAAESFQNDFGLDITGFVDEKTFIVLTNFHKARFGEIETAETEKITEIIEPTESAVIKEIEKKSAVSNDNISLENSQNDLQDNLINDSINKDIHKKNLQHLQHIKDEEFQKRLEIINKNKFDDEIKYNNFDLANIFNDDVAHKDYYAGDIVIKTNHETKSLTPDKNNNFVILKFGSVGGKVFELQSVLKGRNYFDGKLNGIFDDATKDAVLKYQKANKLECTGIPDKKTWNSLNAKPQKIETELKISDTEKRQETREYNKPKLNKNQGKMFDNSHESKSDNSDIYISKEEQRKKLDDLYGYENYAKPLETQEISESEETDSYTKQEFKSSNVHISKENHQKIISNPHDNQEPVNYARDWNKLTPINITPIDNFGEHENNFSKPTLKMGDEGNYVKLLQEMLIEYEFLKALKDGKFGEKTYDALIKFQNTVAEVGLTPDGIVGAKTWKALETYNPNDYKTKRPQLKYGATGEDVYYLQQKLKDFGFYNGKIDGIFGYQTSDAAELFQTAMKIKSDGIVGDVTWHASDVYSPAPEKTYPTLKFGDGGNYVASLQTKLKEYGFYNGKIDGIFGYQTLESVNFFQNACGLETDGVVGEKTWEALSDYMNIPENYPTVQYGNSGTYVTILQTKLKDLGFYHGSITGSFDTNTENSLIAYQRDYNLPQTGIADRNTWAFLFSDSYVERDISEYKENKKTLRYGDTGEYVYYLQQQLKNLRYYGGNVSGQFDINTETAVRGFQYANGLTADGVVGKYTRYALESLINSFYRT